MDRLVREVFGSTGDAFRRMTGDCRASLALGASAAVRLSEGTLMITVVEEEVVVGIEVGLIVCCGINVEGKAWLVPVRYGGSSMLGGVR